jgi:hypothetical protein
VLLLLPAAGGRQALRTEGGRMTQVFAASKRVVGRLTKKGCKNDCACGWHTETTAFILGVASVNQTAEYRELL